MFFVLKCSEFGQVFGYELPLIDWNLRNCNCQNIGMMLWGHLCIWFLPHLCPSPDCVQRQHNLRKQRHLNMACSKSRCSSKHPTRHPTNTPTNARTEPRTDRHTFEQTNRTSSTLMAPTVHSTLFFQNCILTVQ